MNWYGVALSGIALAFYLLINPGNALADSSNVTSEQEFTLIKVETTSPKVLDPNKRNYEIVWNTGEGPKLTSILVFRTEEDKGIAEVDGGISKLPFTLTLHFVTGAYHKLTIEGNLGTFNPQDSLGFTRDEPYDGWLIALGLKEDLTLIASSPVLDEHR